MSNNYFRFKQFTVNQEHCAMKVGTDGVLLGAWVSTGRATRILDIGTGTGLIALMLAQRSEAVIDAIEIDEKASRQAQENFSHSPWAERLQSVHQSYTEYCRNGQHYDLIVSNPPYHRNSLLSPLDTRTVARHDRGMTINELITGVMAQLNDGGRFGIIYPAEGIDMLIRIAGETGLCLIRRADVIPAPGKIVKRVMAEFSGKPQPLITESIIIEKHGRHLYSEEYKRLTSDFYLDK